jgi:hypothetical protein
MASSVKLVETLEEDIKDSIEIATSRVDSLLVYTKRSTIYIKRKSISLINILRIKRIKLITNLRKYQSIL